LAGSDAYDPHKDSLGSWEHGIAAQRLRLVLERSASEFGDPLPAGLATFMAGRLVRDIPQLLDAIASAAQGKVK
jgi:hypothetical protein